MDVEINDIWTCKLTGEDYAVKDIGVHSETGKKIVILSNYKGETICHPLDLFLFRHELTHRVHNMFIIYC